MYCGPVDAAAAPVGEARDAPTYREPPPKPSEPRVIEAPAGAGKLGLFQTTRARVVAALVALVALVALSLTCVAYWPRSPGVDTEVAARLAPSLPGWAEAARSAEVGAPYVRGALVPMELRADEVPPDDEHGPAVIRIADAEPDPTWRVADVWDLLDPSLHPDDPGDVGTVALMTCRERAVGHYETGYGESARSTSPALQWVCQLEVVDVVAGRRVDRVAFYGSPPPREVAVGSTQHGTHPRFEIADYLNALPRGTPAS